jgi:glycosyltransferase involved in cell wall biosynthesis
MSGFGVLSPLRLPPSGQGCQTASVAECSPTSGTHPSRRTLMPSALFIHNGSPGRFAFIGQALVERGWTARLINGPDGRDIPGVETCRWKPPAGAPQRGRGPKARIARDLAWGGAAAQAALQLRDAGFSPDIIIGHPGWGEMLFLHHIFPRARQIQIAEFFYQADTADVGFDPEFSPPPANLESALATEAKNIGLAASYVHADCLVAPTPYQASLLPPALRKQVRVIHEGVDTAVARRRDATLTFSGGLTLKGEEPVITFVNRNFEPLRGVHVFMRALPELMKAAPEARIIMIGADSRECYGPLAPEETTWLRYFQKELGDQVDHSRIHLPGQVSYPQLLDVLSLSTAHVYLTYPFVLSWSLLDAMACEALIIASDTAPVRDVIVHEENGLLVDFFDVGSLSRRLIEACRTPEAYVHLRRAARDSVVKRYDRRSVCLPQWLALIESLAGSPAW